MALLSSRANSLVPGVSLRASSKNAQESSFMKPLHQKDSDSSRPNRMLPRSDCSGRRHLPSTRSDQTAPTNQRTDQPSLSVASISVLAGLDLTQHDGIARGRGRCVWSPGRPTRQVLRRVLPLETRLTVSQGSSASGWCKASVRSHKGSKQHGQNHQLNKPLHSL